MQRYKIYGKTGKVEQTYRRIFRKGYCLFYAGISQSSVSGNDRETGDFDRGRLGTVGYPRGAHIVELGEQSHNTGVLLDGTMEEFFYDENGNQISICRFCPGEVFGAELACTGWTASPVCLRASSDCTVMQLDFSALMSQKTLSCPCRMQVTANLMQDMAQQLLFFNTKVRILAQKRLRDRLKIYLQTLTPDEKGCYSLPYTRTELADFLCVDRSALSRELCRMRDERILDFSGAKIHLLNPTFLYGWN